MARRARVGSIHTGPATADRDGGGRGGVSDEPRHIGRRALFGRLLRQAPEEGHWVKVHRTAMACRFEVTLPTEDARHVETARAALDEVDAIERQLTWFRDTSETMRVNQAAAA